MKQRRLTKAEREALAKVETGYVSMSDGDELLIIDDTAYFRQCELERNEREKEDEAERQRILGQEGRSE